MCYNKAATYIVEGGGPCQLVFHQYCVFPSQQSSTFNITHIRRCGTISQFVSALGNHRPYSSPATAIVKLDNYAVILSSIMICLMLECFLEFLDVFKTAMLLCFPSWCLWHLSCFLWKRSMRPLLYRILSSDLFFRCTVIYHEYCRWPVTYPPSSHMTVEETKTFCQQGYLVRGHQGENLSFIFK